MTKKILVPTDFSENALSAVKYACKLAIKNNYHIYLLHCYTSKSVGLDDHTDENITPDSTLKADLLMNYLKDSIQQEFPTLTVETQCTRGILTDVVLQTIKDSSYSLIVMGTTGAGENKSVTWGSNTSQISSKATIPVLAIPAGYTAFALDKVALLSNFKAEELETLKEYVLKVNPIAHLDLIHVYKNERAKGDIEEQLQAWATNVSYLNGVESVNTIAQPILSDNKALDTIPEVINHIIEYNEYDIILITKTRKSFFNRLFQTSISKEVALHLRKPTFFDKI